AWVECRLWRASGHAKPAGSWRARRASFGGGSAAPKQHAVDDVDHAVRRVDISDEDLGAADGGRAALNRGVDEVTVEGPDPSGVQDVAADRLALCDVLEQDGAQRSDGDVVEPLNAQQIVEILERRV